MKRTPLKRGTKELRRRTPLARVGRRSKANRAKRAHVVALVLLRDRYRCQFNVINPAFASGCSTKLDVHEIIPRSAWSAGVLEVDNCVVLCRRHHAWVDAHPDLAAAVGLHGWSWQRPDRRAA